MKRNSLNIKINTYRCDLCGACVGVCPENVISMSINELSIDHEGCTRCSKCVWVCPVRALKLTKISPHFASNEVSIDQNPGV